jgi:hypothetical protein
MTTKEEYEKALKEMNDAFYGITFLNSQTRRFDDNLNLLRELVNEHFEEKKESNLEHYKEEIKSAGYDFALVNGKPTTCKWILCDQCFFKDRILCAKKRIEWMLKPFKRKYKLTQFEYDLLQSYASGYKFKDIMPLIVMKEKGYFKDINKDEKITDILWNCGVIKND